MLISSIISTCGQAGRQAKYKDDGSTSRQVEQVRQAGEQAGRTAEKMNQQ
jgi:hypothetical protein